MPGKQSTKKRVMNEQSDSASQRVPVAAQDPQMTADNFEGEIEKAESKIQEVREVWMGIFLDLIEEERNETER